MPGMDDFHAFKSTSGGAGGSGGAGCGSNIFIWIIAIIIFLWMVGKIFG